MYIRSVECQRQPRGGFIVLIHYLLVKEPDLTGSLQGWTTQTTLSTMMLILTRGLLHLTPAGLGESTRSTGQ